VVNPAAYDGAGVVAAGAMDVAPGDSGRTFDGVAWAVALVGRKKSIANDR